MKNNIALVVRFRVVDSVREKFLSTFNELFTHIVKEETFVEASLVQDTHDPESLLNYEVWEESAESFTKDQMTRSYRADFEKMIVDLKIERTPAWFSPIGKWTRA